MEQSFADLSKNTLNPGKSILLWYVNGPAERSSVFRIFRKRYILVLIVIIIFRKNSLLWQVDIFIDTLHWKIFPIYFKIVGYLKERGFDKEVLRKVKEFQVSYFVSLYNVTIVLSILALLNNSMNRSTSSGEDVRAGYFSDERSFMRELFDTLTSPVSYNVKFSMMMRCPKQIKVIYMWIFHFTHPIWQMI